jgi:hypothetical protein
MLLEHDRSVAGSGYAVGGRQIRYLMPETWYQVPGTRYLEPGIIYDIIHGTIYDTVYLSDLVPNIKIKNLYMGPLGSP